VTAPDTEDPTDEPLDIKMLSCPIDGDTDQIDADSVDKWRAFEGRWGEDGSSGHGKHDNFCASPENLPTQDTTILPNVEFSTDREQDGATPDDPIEVSIISQFGGSIAVEKESVGIPSSVFADYEFFTGWILSPQSSIFAPAGTPVQPLRITFRLDKSVRPFGIYQVNGIVVFRNGTPVDGCEAPDGRALPDPCIASVTELPDGDVEIVVLTSHASTWNFGVPAQSLAGMVKVTNLQHTYDRHDSRGPDGVLTVTATVKNVSDQNTAAISFVGSILNPESFAVLNCDNGPRRVDCIVTVPDSALGGDGLLSPSESFQVTFEVAVSGRPSFKYEVRGFGIVVPD
jgi:hypothetical protein